MPVEAAGVRHGGHAGDQRELAQRQLRVALLAALEPGLHLGPGGGPGQRIVERRRVAFQDGAFAAGVPDQHLGPGLGSALGVSGQHQFGAELIKLEAENLTKA